VGSLPECQLRRRLLSQQSWIPDRDVERLARTKRASYSASGAVQKGPHSSLPAVVGVLPAAGHAKRISPSPCSKEIYPIGLRTDERTGELRPRVVSQHLFDKFRAAGVRTAYVVLRTGKWDIPAYFGDGELLGVDVVYKVIAASLGPPDTIDRLYRFVSQSCIAFAFPDMLFGPNDVFTHLLDRLEATRAAIVLALHQTEDIHRMDMIDVDEGGQVRSIELKPRESALSYTWTCAVWTPVFTEFLHRFVANERLHRSDGIAPRFYDIDASGDLPMGAVLQAAIANGISIQTVAFPGETFIDIGTPEYLEGALRRSLSGEP
jgi:NDP-sugar pyrophosphorylase family protein